MKNRSIKTTHKQILEYHYEHTNECGLGCDADEWHHRCWRCGYVRSLERCHIIPNSLGGPDEPSNYVLLCNDCHLENPNVKDSNEMWNWIRRTSVSTYDTFWELRNILKETVQDSTHHFGEVMNKSTKYWILREYKKRLEKQGISYTFISNIDEILRIT